MSHDVNEMIEELGVFKDNHLTTPDGWSIQISKYNKL